MFKFVKKTSIIHKYLAYYGIMFAIPLIILGSILYNNSVLVLQKELEDYNLQKVYGVQEIIEKQFKDIEKIAVKISFNTDLYPFVVQRNEYWALNAVNELNKYKTSNILLDDILLYFRDGGYVYSDKGKMSLSTMFDSTVKIGDDKKEGFQRILDTTITSKMAGYQEIRLSQSNNKYFLTYFYPVPAGRRQPYATIAFTMRNNTVEQLIGNIFGSLDGCFYILDDKKNIVFKMGDDIEAFSSIADVVGKDDFKQNTRITIENKLYSVIDVVSPELKWHYVTVASAVYYLESVGHMRNRIILILFLVIMLGIGGAYLFASSSFKPIKRLYDNVIAKNGKFKDINSRNEIENIESSINATLESFRNVSKQLDDQQPLVKEQIMAMLLKGALTDKTIEKLLPVYDIKLEKSCFAVTVIAHLNGNDILSYREKTGYAEKILQNRLEAYEYYMLELISGRIALLINTGGEKATREYINDLLKEIYDYFDANLHVRLNIGSGNIYDNINDITKSYIEALAVVDHNMIKGCNSVLFFSDLVTSESEFKWFPMEQQIRLEQCIKQGNIYITRDIVKDIIETIRNKQLSTGMTRTVCFGIIYTIVRLINEMDTDQFSRDIELMSGFNSLDDLGEILENVVYKLQC